MDYLPWKFILVVKWNLFITLINLNFLGKTASRPMSKEHSKLGYVHFLRAISVVRYLIKVVNFINLNHLLYVLHDQCQPNTTVRRLPAYSNSNYLLRLLISGYKTLNTGVERIALPYWRRLLRPLTMYTEIYIVNAFSYELFFLDC